MRLASSTAIRFTYVSIVSAITKPAYLATRNCARPTGLDSTARAVPVRISRASEAEALNTAPSKPASSITASVLFLTSLGSSPNAK